jgi:glutamate/tyrosine decarboxylase-like PLP-dependent enzyme
MGLARQRHSRRSARVDESELCPHHALAEHGLGQQTAYEMISNELLLDGSARLNLATFVTTWMPSLAGELMAQTADKNMIDKDEYPQTAEIEARCVNIIADLCSAGAFDRLLNDRLERGGDARGARAQVALARADAVRRQADR